MKYIKGDLIELFKQGEFDIIAHQCNCFSIFGAGIAKRLVEEFPAIELQDKQSDYSSIDRFGTIDDILVRASGYRTIINIYSQYRPGGCTLTGIDSFEVRLGALENCLYQINKNNKGLKIGLPLLASGLAKKKSNLDDLSYFHSFILPSVKKCLRDMKVTIVYL